MSFCFCSNIELRPGWAKENCIFSNILSFYFTLDGNDKKQKRNSKWLKMFVTDDVESEIKVR